MSSGAGGSELPALSLLGPFMAVSVFADENPAVAEKYFAEKPNPATIRHVAQSLQQDLEFMRVRQKQKVHGDGLNRVFFWTI